MFKRCEVGKNVPLLQEAVYVCDSAEETGGTQVQVRELQSAGPVPARLLELASEHGAAVGRSEPANDGRAAGQRPHDTPPRLVQS